MSDSDWGGLSVNGTKFVVNYVVRFLFAAILIYTCWIPFQYLGGWFSYHVILCTFGYIPLMAEAIMMFVGDDIWSRQMSRKAKYSVHGYLMAASTLVVIVGNALVFHYIEPGYHLYTVHGITGLISMIIIILSLALGYAVNYPEVAQQFFSMRTVCYKLNHNIFGILGYSIGIISLCFGYYTEWFKYFYGEESRLVVLLLTIVVSIWPLHGAFTSAYHQVKAALS